MPNDPTTEFSSSSSTAIAGGPGDPGRMRGPGSFFGHPPGLSTLFFTEMWERFSYYGLRPLMVLFMIAALRDGGFGFDRTTASSIVGIYAASVYLASLPGGFIADRLLGLRRAIFLGAVLISLGHLSIGLSAIFAKPAFFLGLVFIVMGTGLLKPNISAIVGDLYPEGGSRRDAGFSIFYMGINVGAFFGQLVTGLLGEHIGWHYGFGAAGVGMLAGLFVYWLTASKTLGNIGMEPARDPDPLVQATLERRIKLGIGLFVAVILLLFFLTMAGMITIDAAAVAQNMSYVMAGIVVLYFAYVFLLGGLTTDDKKRVAVIFVLFLFAMVFWAAFEQAPTSLNLFAADFTRRTVFGWEVPALWFQSINSAFIILLAPFFAALWIALGRRNRDLSSPAKFSLGLAFAALGFAIMIFAAQRVVSGGGAPVSAWWLVFSYLFQTVGELSLSPVGLSSMTKLAPLKFKGQMMGVWFMAAAIGNLIAGLVGGHVDPENLEQMPLLFQRTTLSLLVATGVLLLLIVPIRRMMATTADGEGRIHDL
jgi:POT family proton-dependent oligopeptide transporter